MKEGDSLSKLKIAICDDEPRAITIISASVESIFKDLGEEISLETFLTPDELAGRLRSRAFDLIFLDISMPKKDGITLGKELQQYGSTAELVFVSSRMDRMYDTFAVRPFGFVRKTHFLEDMDEVIRRFTDHRNRSEDRSRMAQFKDGQGIVSINVSKVTFIECVRNTQIFHFEDSAEEHRIYSRMETLEEELKPYGFIRIHKGYLASAKYIRRFDSKGVTLTTGQELPIGRSRQHAAMDEYLHFIGKSTDSQEE